MLEWITTSSVLILIIIVVRYIFKGKIKLSIQYGLWLLVLIRLLIPFSLFNSNISVMNIFLGIFAEQETQENLYKYKQEEEKQPIQNGQFDINNTESNPNKSVSNKSNIDLYEQSPDSSKPNPDLIQSNPGYNNIDKDSYIDENKQPSDQSSTLIIDVLLFIWIFGMILSAAILTVSTLYFRKKLLKDRKAIEYKDSRLPIYITNMVSSPCIFGILHPCIYITSDIQEYQKKLRYVIRHENTHYIHNDHIWAIMRSICVILHWYNPLVWIAASLSRRDAELVCDEGTIRNSCENERIDYGEVLISLAVKKAAVIESISCITAMSGEKKHLKERITMIAQKPKQKKGAAAMLILICILTVVITFTGGKNNSENQESNPNYASLPDNGNEINNLDDDINNADISEHIDDEQNLTQVMGYIGYTGYLDECTNWTDYNNFLNCDYNGDGLTDRVYRWESNDKCSYRIEFSNGDILEFEDGSWHQGVLHIQAADLTGDGQNEIIVYHTYDYSTNLTAFGEFAICSKKGDSYESIELPFEKDSDNFSQWLNISYGNTGNEFFRISCTEADYDVMVEVNEQSVIEQYRNYNESNTQEVVYNVAIDKSDKNIDKLVCYIGLFGKYSTDELRVTLGYSEGVFYIENIKYYDHYIIEHTITVDNGRELTISMYEVKEYGSEVYGIKSIEITENRDDAGYCIQNIQISDIIDYNDMWGMAYDGVKCRIESESYMEYDTWILHDQPQPWYRNIYIVIEDLNFDGYEDFRIEGCLSHTGITPYYCFIWDVDKQEFVYSFSFSDIEIDKEKKQLIYLERLDDRKYQTTCYEYDEAGKLKIADQYISRYDRQGILHIVKRMGVPLITREEDESLTYVETSYSLTEQDFLNGEYWNIPYKKIARDALEELYYLTGTKIDECCFTVTAHGTFIFGLTKEDIIKDRNFFSRSYQAEKGFSEGITSINLTSADSVWYSTIYHNIRPENLDSMTDEEICIWYLERSALSNGKKVENMNDIVKVLVDTYVVMTSDGSYFEIHYDSSLKEVGAIYGPYPGWPEH